MIETIVLGGITSRRKKYEIKGTNTYPRDSRIGKSFRLTPLLIAVILIRIDIPRIAYAATTLLFSIEAINEPCSSVALFFSNT